MLEELIESFKNIEMKYESDIKNLQDILEDTRGDFDEKLKKV